MTWEEFKNHVEKELKKNDISMDTKVEYICAFHPSLKNKKFIPEVWVDNGQLRILGAD